MYFRFSVDLKYGFFLKGRPVCLRRARSSARIHDRAPLQWRSEPDLERSGTRSRPHQLQSIFQYYELSPIDYQRIHTEFAPPGPDRAPDLHEKLDAQTACGLASVAQRRERCRACRPLRERPRRERREQPASRGHRARRASGPGRRGAPPRGRSGRRPQNGERGSAQAGRSHRRAAYAEWPARLRLPASWSRKATGLHRRGDGRGICHRLQWPSPSCACRRGPRTDQRAVAHSRYPPLTIPARCRNAFHCLESGY